MKLVSISGLWHCIHLSCSLFLIHCIIIVGHQLKCSQFHSNVVSINALIRVVVKQLVACFVQLSESIVCCMCTPPLYSNDTKAHVLLLTLHSPSQICFEDRPLAGTGVLQFFRSSLEKTSSSQHTNFRLL